MQTKDAIRSAMSLSDMVFRGYLSDLDDNEILMRPAPGCNHPAWQFGHLIASEAFMLDSMFPGKAAKLPDGFAESHGKERADVDGPDGFCSKQQYLELMDQVRQSTLAVLDEIPEESLDDPSPESFRDFCPTVGQMFLLIGSHPMMHAGQFVPLRRELGKPVMF